MDWIIQTLQGIGSTVTKLGSSIVKPLSYLGMWLPPGVIAAITTMLGLLVAIAIYRSVKP